MVPERASAALLSLLLVLPAAAALPTGGQDDAGSGGDASDACTFGPDRFLGTGGPQVELATPTALGRFNGTLAGRWRDAVDCYVLEVDRPGVLTVEARAETRKPAEVCIEIRQKGPAGGSCLLEYPMRVLVAPDRPVYLDLAINSIYWNSTYAIPYTLNITLEPHDRYRWIDETANETLTWTGRLDTNRFVGVRLTGSDREYPQESAPYAMFLHFRVKSPDGDWSLRWAGLFVGDSWTGNSLVWSEGNGPADLDVSASAEAPPSGGILGAVFEKWGAGPVNVTFHGAATHGVRLGGLLVWDDPGTGSIATSATRRGNAVFATASDFEGGSGAGAGPVAVANDRRLTVDADQATRMVFADARTDRSVKEPTRMRVRAPDGSVTNLTESAAFWGPSPWTPRAPAGPWTAYLDHADGVRDSPLRFIVAEFPETAPES